MRTLAALLAFVPTASCAEPQPFRFSFPLEIGAPARRDDGSMAIVLERLTLSDMQRLPVAACRPESGMITVGCSLRSNHTCTIYLPLEAHELDQLRIEVHERRHCLGQEHETILGPDGTFMLRWLP